MNVSKNTSIVWFGRDLRLKDAPLLHEAKETGGPIVPVFIYDSVMQDMLGAAPKWRLHQALESLAQQLEDTLGARLILRRGDALEVLNDLIDETDATTVLWSRQYDRASIERNTAIKDALTERGMTAKSVNSSLMFEPWTVETKTGGYYKVYSPFMRSLDRDQIRPLLDDIDSITLPDQQDWPASDTLAHWNLEADMNRGGSVVAQYASVGEDAAATRLEEFLEDNLAHYKTARNYFAKQGCSGLSQHLTWGEISPNQIWYATTERAKSLGKDAGKDIETFLKEIIWREFAYHLLYHVPDLPTQNFREDWDKYPWRDDNEDAQTWREGRTGVPLVDAAMREMYVTGTMHNRARMMVASYLCKHLLTHWRVGEQWFRNCLIDWDIASNALGWQWTAGSGPDAAPYFRIYNADSQIEQYDPKGEYLKRYLAEPYDNPEEPALQYFSAIPKSWGMTAQDDYRDPVIEHKAGRERALEAYKDVKA